MRYIIWDFDGTLAYRNRGFAGALLDAVTESALNMRFTVEQLRPSLTTGFPWHTPEIPHPELTDPDTWWQSLEPVFEIAYRSCGLDPETSRQLARSVRTHYCNPKHWAIYDDVPETLRELSANHWQHIVLSNHVPELRHLIEELGLSAYISAVYNSAETGYEKPHPAAFKMVLTDLQAHEKLWMVGDSWTADIRGARLAGIPGILVRNSHPDARWQCHTLTEVAKLVEQ